MFCGHRLPDPEPEVTAEYLVDPAVTTDLPTRSFEPPVPAPAEVRASGPPERIGKFRLLRHLGSGGMGSVYEAESDDSGDMVAIKLLSPKLAANPLSVERFRQEGMLASQITHPRCVFVYGADTDNGRPYIIMELMPGTTLKDLVHDNGPLPEGEAIVRALDVIDGLTEAHRFGVIHRDVKPSNCFLTADDRVKIGDFGLSKSLDGQRADHQLTTTGAFLGTVLFAPPEQIRGEEVSYDSDVYSVCATLYFLLTGKAPYQHESLTAVMAKAISEPPPPMRSIRPGIPRSLDRIVLKGLERDRGRRWASLEELRDALADQLPGRQLPARPRSLIAAYLIDSLVVAFVVQFPIQAMETMIGGIARLPEIIATTAFDPVIWIGAILYFAILEGLYGMTPGKWLLRLRVVRIGQIGPPGLRPALIRSFVFNMFWFALTVLPGVLFAVPYLGGVLAVGAVIFALLALGCQLRASHGYRGLHDFASGCRVLQRARPIHRMRLVSQYPGLLDHGSTNRSDLPTSVAGFDIRGVVHELPDNQAVWLAEDRSLSRRVLLWVYPSDGVRDALPPARPTRLRAIGTGMFEYHDRTMEWIAFVAPQGGPLPDMINPQHPLNWADARLLIEQIVEELLAAEKDGTLPDRIGVDQLWAEPTGRIHLVDFPLPVQSGPVEPAQDSLGLIRQTATLLLEGKVRDSGKRLAAPIPPHASNIAERLFGPTPYTKLNQVHDALVESHTHEPRVTNSMRLVQIGLTTILASIGLVGLLGMTIGLQLWTALAVASQSTQLRMVQTGLDDPAILARWQTQPRLVPYVNDEQLPETRNRLNQLTVTFQNNLQSRKRVLTRPERYLVENLEFLVSEELTPATLAPQNVERVMVVTTIAYRDPKVPHNIHKGMSWTVYVLASVMLAGFMIFAILFRGGLSYLLAGLAIVRQNGLPAERWRCAVRELLAWIPIMACVLLAVGLQTIWPYSFTVRLVAIITVLVGFLASIIVTVRAPDRGPHDRMLGTTVVPL